MALTYGSEYTWQTGEADEIAVAMLDSTHAIVVFRDVANSQFGTAVIATIDGTEITYGSEYIFAYAGAPTCHVARLSDTQAIICYTGTNQYGYARTANISNGNEITFGTAVAYTSYISYTHSVAVLDSTHFITFFQDADDATIEAKAVVGVIDGTAIDSFGTVVIVNANTSYKLHISALDSTHAIVVYQDAVGDWQGYAKVLTISSGTTISQGTAVAVDTSSVAYMDVAALDSTHFIAIFGDEGTSNQGTAIVGVVSSGDTITFGSQYVFDSSSTSHACVAKMDSTHAFITYKDAGNSNYGTGIVATISNDDEIAYGTAVVFNEGITEFTGVSALSSTKVIIAYQDETNSNAGTGIVGTTGYATPTLSVITKDGSCLEFSWS